MATACWRDLSAPPTIIQFNSLNLPQQTTDNKQQRKRHQLPLRCHGNKTPQTNQDKQHGGNHLGNTRVTFDQSGTEVQEDSYYLSAKLQLHWYPAGDSILKIVHAKDQNSMPFWKNREEIGVTVWA